jgi:hypothetical protein
VAGDCVVKYSDKRRHPGHWTAHAVEFAVIAALVVGAIAGVFGTKVEQHYGNSAGRPGLTLVPGAPVGNQGGLGAAFGLAAGEGTGAAWCGAFGGEPLGASFDDVYACGPSTGTSDSFDSTGFQCVELSERMMWIETTHYVAGVDFGRNFVSDASAQTGLPIGIPAPHSLPLPGDIVSMWGGPAADSFGHTAVVIGVHVDRSGNGTVSMMEENGSVTGLDEINVHAWAEAYGDPNYAGGLYYYDFVEWLKIAKAPPPKPEFPAKSWHRFNHHVPYRSGKHLTFGAAYWLHHRHALLAPLAGARFHHRPHYNGFALQPFKSAHKKHRRVELVWWLHRHYRPRVT